ncbi:endoglucanase 2 [Populus alba x Populus x berolinensis]|nr:endoglucanase 2 [Populus alba x Populus x berolinensis]
MNLDLSKGMYDAGDLMKFGFPMAFTTTMLSLAILEYGENMKTVKQLGHDRDSLKWITDFLINAHPSENVLYIQVGDPELDHQCWERPEAIRGRRPLTQVNTSFLGTEVAAETAAAMASASLVFKKIDSSYSNLLLEHAQQLFSFADAYRGSYSGSIPQVQNYYNSTGYEDELLRAATWLYHASKDLSYLKYVTELNGQQFANWGNPSWFSWDDKHAGTHVLLSRLNIFGAKGMSSEENLDLQMYRKTSEAIMCELLPDSPTATSSRTKDRTEPNREHPYLQHVMASAFLAVLFSDYMVTAQISTLYCHGKSYSPAGMRDLAISQITHRLGCKHFQADYILGNNPMKMSYLVGYGSNYPQNVHGLKDGFTWLDSINPNPNVAVGEVVGGHLLNETYIDSRNNRMQAEPTTYNSALVVSLLSSLVRSSSVVDSFTNHRRM